MKQDNYYSFKPALATTWFCDASVGETGLEDWLNFTMKNNAAAKRFEAQVGDHLAVIQYQQQGNRIIFTHTSVPPALEGQGVGSNLAQFALEYAKAQQLEVVPLCPFVRSYINRHPEYQSLVSHAIQEPIND